jgi:spore coat polysaccharide biosynthesis protein SpsF
MKPISGKYLIAHMVERVRRAKELDEIVIATSWHGQDDILEWQAHELGVGCFRGPEDDVLKRVLDAARAYKADVIVELTGDCPLMDPAIIDTAVQRFNYMTKALLLDMLSTTRDSLRMPRPYFPRGMDVRVFRRHVLADLDKLTADDPVSREHVSLYAWEHRNRFNVANLPAAPELCSDARLTVDTPEDLLFIRTIFAELYPVKPWFSLEDVLELLKRRPELTRINDRVPQKAIR